MRTTVRFDSRLGSARKQGADAAGSDEPEVGRKGLLSGISTVSGWSKGSVQRTIEQFGVRRIRDQLGRSAQGMNIVLEQL